jgi:ribulose-5-phosphate 4-epimerase/fuculose-1-phosphate aldolase
MHVHSIHATVLASLADSRLPAIDQNSAMFHNRQVVDDHFAGMAFEEEGKRCAQLLADPKITTMIMGNHGVLVIGATVAETFNRLYYFERAAETYIRALQTGRPAALPARRGRRKDRARMGNLPRLCRCASVRTPRHP